MTRECTPALSVLGTRLRFRTKPLDIPGFDGECLEVDRRSFDVLVPRVCILVVSVETGMDSDHPGAHSSTPRSPTLKTASPATVSSQKSSSASKTAHQRSLGPSKQQDTLESNNVSLPSLKPPEHAVEPQTKSYTFKNLPLQTGAGWGWANLMEAAFPGDEDTASLLKVSRVICMSSETVMNQHRTSSIWKGSCQPVSEQLGICQEVLLHPNGRW